jgi:hypothetical protein
VTPATIHNSTSTVLRTWSKRKRITLISSDTEYKTSKADEGKKKLSKKTAAQFEKERVAYLNMMIGCISRRRFSLLFFFDGLVVLLFVFKHIEERREKRLS